MGMMLAENLSERAQGARLPVVRSHPPDEGAGGPVDDGHDARVPAADDDVVRIEPAITSVVPLVGSKVCGRIHMQPVATPAVLDPARIAANDIARLHAETKAVDVVAR